MRAKLLTGALIHLTANAMLLLLSVVVARSLGAYGYGEYVYAMAIASVLATLAMAGAPQLILRDVAVAHDTGNRSKAALVVKRGISFVVRLSLVVICLAGSAVAWHWYSGAYSPEQTLTYAFVLVLVPLIVLVVVGAHILRGFDQTRASQLIELWVRPFLTLVMVFVVFWINPDWRQPQTVVLIQIAAALITLIGVGALLHRLSASGWLRWRSEGAMQWQSLMVSLLPFASISIAMSVQSQADLIMLGLWVPSEEVGIYRVATQGAVLVVLSLTVLNMVFSARIAALNARGDNLALQLLITRIARLAFLTALPLSLVLVVYGGPLAGFIFGEQFARSAYPLAILTASQMVSVSFGVVGTLLLLSGYERESARALWAMVAANILLNLLLIPLYGMVGAAIATAISIVFWNLLLYLTVRSKMRLNPTILSSYRA